MPEVMNAPNSAAGAIDRAIAAVKTREKVILLGAVGLQVLFLVAMIASRGLVALRGETVLLQVVPVDPRDLMRGEYVILGYDFSRGVPPGASEGQTVYVSLEPAGADGHYRAGPASLSRPSGGKFLRGQVEGGRVVCGIESFFVQEGKGRRYEEAIRSRRLYAEIAVDPEGKAMVRGLRIE